MELHFLRHGRGIDASDREGGDDARPLTEDVAAAGSGEAPGGAAEAGPTTTSPSGERALLLQDQPDRGGPRQGRRGRAA